MSRKVPMGACLALLKAFEPNRAAPQQDVAATAAYVEGVIGPDVAAALNDGQFAALIDYAMWQGEQVFEESFVRAWVEGGNYANPPRYLATMGLRGRAERDVWNVGAGA